MSTSCSSTADTMKSSVASDSRQSHRRIVIVGGSLAVIGAALALFVDPAWAGLVALGGLALILFPDRNCCGR
ncbi:MAG: hypothetical protein K8U57_05855 [Planctomycetes bacterium]|nr:hypothetical protein [Planctomycetota bacterium]